MSGTSYDSIRMIIGDTNSAVRQGIKTALFAHGFRNIRDASRLPTLHAALEQNEADLVVCDCSLPEGDVSAMIYDVRHNRIGDNPFIVLIAMAASPTPDVIARVIDSGADDLIAKPISPAILIDRVTRLTRARKRFVVTNDYIGPNRRDTLRPDDEAIPLIEVPNPLSAKTTGQSVSELQKQIDAARMLINEEKMLRHARQIAYLVDQLVPKYQAGETDDTIIPALDRLLSVAQDISRRLEGTRFSHVGDLCQSMVDLASKVRTDPMAPKPKDLRLMPELAGAISTAFSSEAHADLAYDISETVRRYAGPSAQ